MPVSCTPKKAAGELPFGLPFQPDSKYGHMEAPFPVREGKRDLEFTKRAMLREGTHSDVKLEIVMRSSVSPLRTAVA